MSFEGYFQVLCGNGHYHEFDAYEWDRWYGGEMKESWKCNALIKDEPCYASVREENLVDDTNCDSWGLKKKSRLNQKSLNSAILVILI